MISRTLGVLSKVVTNETMHFVVERILPLLDTSDNLVYRQGAVEALSRIFSENILIDRSSLRYTCIYVYIQDTEIFRYHIADS